DNRVPRPLLDTNDAPFRSAAGLAQRDLHFHLVAVHRGTDQRGRYIDVALHSWNFLFWNNEAVTITMNENRALDQTPRRRLVAVSPVLREFSFFDELIEDVFDLLARPRRRVEIAKDVLQIGAA